MRTVYVVAMNLCLWTQQGSHWIQLVNPSFSNVGNWETDAAQAMEDRPPQRTRNRTLTGDAYALHESVPPDRWCVTWKNLEYLRKEVGKLDGEWRKAKMEDDSRDSNGSV